MYETFSIYYNHIVVGSILLIAAIVNDRQARKKRHTRRIEGRNFRSYRAITDSLDPHSERISFLVRPSDVDHGQRETIQSQVIYRSPQYTPFRYVVMGADLRWAKRSRGHCDRSGAVQSQTINRLVPIGV